MTILKTVEQLEALYGRPGETSLVKELDRIIPEYAAFIEASPFVALATAGPEGLDCSPRGDLAGFVRIEDERTLLMPDRHGTTRTDSLRNIVRDGMLGLLFLLPGSGTRPRQRPCRASVAQFARVVHRRGQAAALDDRHRGRAVYFHTPAPSTARNFKSGRRTSIRIAADAGRDPCVRQRQPDRRRGLRPCLAGAGEENDVVRRAGVP